jgi:twitching motility protein PilT
MARFHGQLEPLSQHSEPLTPSETERVRRAMLAAHSDKMAAFDAENEIDFSYTVPDLARFRVNAFRQRGSVSIVARVIPFTVRTVARAMLAGPLKAVVSGASSGPPTIRAASRCARSSAWPAGGAT